jgi:Bacterial SH3 domain
MRRSTVALLIAMVPATLSLEPTSAASQDHYYYLVDLDPHGDNWLALRSEPSLRHGSRLAKMGPETLLVVLGRKNEWVEVRTTTGQTGWAMSKYIACCKQLETETKGHANSRTESTALANAFRAQAKSLQHMRLEKAVIVSGWALQNWDDENAGGEALFRLDRARGWILIDTGGGAWDLPSLLSAGVPQAIAKQLLIGEQ